LEFLKRAGTSTVARKASATAGPNTEDRHQARVHVVVPDNGQQAVL
jgi:hypothetical protein